MATSRLPCSMVDKDDVLRFRVSMSEKRAIEAAAERDGLSSSAWLRTLALRAAGALPQFPAGVLPQFPPGTDVQQIAQALADSNIPRDVVRAEVERRVPRQTPTVTPSKPREKGGR